MNNLLHKFSQSRPLLYSAALVVAAALSIGAVATYRILQKESAVTTAQPESTQSQPSVTAADIDEATTSIEGDQIDNELNPTQLDEDLNDLL